MLKSGTIWSKYISTLRNQLIFCRIFYERATNVILMMKLHMHMLISKSYSSIDITVKKTKYESILKIMQHFRANSNDKTKSNRKEKK